MRMFMYLLSFTKNIFFLPMKISTGKIFLQLVFLGGLWLNASY